MAAKFTGSTIAVALVAAAAVGAGITLAVVRTGATSSAAARTPDGKPDFSGIWQALNEAHWDLEAHEARPGAVMQQGVYPYEYARVAAAPVLALGAAGGVPGSVGVVEGDGAIPVQAGGGEGQEGERRELDRPRSGAEVLPPGHPARDVHALPVPDRPEHQQGPYGVRFHEHGAHHPPRPGRGSARLHLHGAFGRPVGGGYARRGRDGVQRQELVGQSRQLPQRRACG